MIISRRVLVRLFWIIFALTMTNYVVMLSWSLPALGQMSGGLVPFDLRPSGYSFEQAKELLGALGDGGIAFYVNVQHKLDLTYPALLGLTLGLAIFLLAPKTWGAWRWVLAAVAIPGPVFDYFENAAVATMLKSGVSGTSAQMVDTASGYTVGKAMGSTIAVALVFLMLVIWLVRGVIAKRQLDKVNQP